ncbi:MAG: 50S ribosomal protein L10 [Treponema sp.]|jgi:large subunit ribosomal protein L10|nr:50S ribosomal protein L10 [Treponema sp.]
MAIVAKKIQDAKLVSINELKETFASAPDFIFTDYRGLTVEQITALRKQLRAKNARYKVVKNNFARLAFEQLSFPDVSSYLVGPTAVTIAPADSNEVAKLLFEFAREVPALKVKGGLVAGSVYDQKQVEAFSRLPGRLDLIAMLMSVMQAPVRNLTVALNDVNVRLVRVLKAVADKKAAEDAA